MSSFDMGSVEKDLSGNLRVKSAATWVTDDTEAPDPTVDVLNEILCIRPISLTNKIVTKSGSVFYAPDNTVEKEGSKLAIGRVVGVGEYAGKRQNVSAVKRGDYVVFPKYGGHRMAVQGVKVIFLPDDCVLARVNPEDVLLDVTI